MRIAAVLAVEQLVDLGGVHLGDVGQAADLGGVAGQRGEVADMLQGELAAARHELAHALGQAFVVGVQADGSGGDLVVGLGAQLVAQGVGGDEDLVLGAAEALDVDRDLAGLDGLADGLECRPEANWPQGD